MHNEVAFPLHAERGAAYLTAPNIAACHAFSTRLGGVSTGVLESLNLSVRRGDTPENVRENWRRLGAAAGLDLTRAVYARQIHSADVRIAHAADAQPPELEPRFTCDGFVTNEPGVPLAVFMADCLPVLLHDPIAGVIGAVHCGWRGSVADILGAAVAQMCALGAHPADIRAAIGPGIGALSHELCRRAGRVVAVELDKALLPILDETMANFDNFEVVSADILKTDIPALVREKLAGLTPIVCANLPYNITTPAITALLESKCFESITVLVQKEVAERLCAAPGSAAYGAFSVYMQYHTAPRLLFEVGRECFQPQPKVTSAVLRAEVRKTPPVAVEDEKFFFRVVYAAFALRRKTIVNSLMTGFGSQLTKEQVTGAVVSAGLAPTVRGEKLGLEEFARLARALAERLPA